MLRAQLARQNYAAVDTTTRTEQASPHRLIALLYEELLSCLRQAEIAVTNDNLPLKSARISKALSILNGLESGLDFARGGDVARSLADVYEGVRRQVIAAGSANDADGLSDAADTIGEIAEAWSQIRQ